MTTMRSLIVTGMTVLMGATGAILVESWAEAQQPAAQQPATQQPRSRQPHAGQQPAQPMSFFVTSAGPGDGANLGGLAGADKHCQTLAAAAGGGSKTWHAYLSTQGADAVNARDRIGKGPWFNAKGARDRAGRRRSPRRYARTSTPRKQPHEGDRADRKGTAGQRRRRHVRISTTS